METPLTLLFISDDPTGLAAIREALETARIPADVGMHTGGEGLAEALVGRDAVIVQGGCAGLDLPALLDRCAGLRPVPPCLVVCSALEPEVELAWLERGVTDVVATDRLMRLAPSLRRAVRESRDHEALREREEELRRMVRRIEEQDKGADSSRDAATGLLTPYGLSMALRRELELAHRTGSSLVAILVVCDDFDKIEQNFAGECVENLLRELSSRLSGQLRRTQILGRLFGGEFLGLFPCTRVAEGFHVAKRLRACADSPVLTDREPLKVDLSLGVVSLPWDVEDLDTALELAREALEEQEEFRGFGGTPGHTLQLGDQRLAFDSELSAVGQPIVSLADESVVGYELLCRGPEQGVFEDPERILELARSQGKLAMADLYCLRTCLKKAQTLAPGLRVHVNLRPSTLFEVPFRVVQLLLRSCANLRLYVELSEEQFIGTPWGLVKRLKALRREGMRLLIDDVGRGRGSLDSVMVLEPDAVKIGAELIRGAGMDVAKQRLVRRLLQLTAAVGCEVIAEGVETSRDAEQARRFGIGLGQGFLWSQPVALA